MLFKNKKKEKEKTTFTKKASETLTLKGPFPSPSKKTIINESSIKVRQTAQHLLSSGKVNA